MKHDHKAMEKMFVEGDCTYREVAVEFDIRPSYVRQIGAKKKWGKKRRNYRAKVEQKTEEEAAEKTAKMNVRHILRWRQVQDKVVEEMEKRDFREAKDTELVGILRTSADGESQARGLPSKRVEHSGDLQIQVAVVKSHDRENRKKLLDRALLGVSEGEAEAEGEHPGGDDGEREEHGDGEARS